MTSFVIKLEWDDKAFQLGMRRLESIGADTGPLMADIAEGLLHSTQDRFNTSVAPDGTPWAPLKASTKAMKKGPRILVEEGYLSGLLRSDFGKDFAEVATAPLPYAQVQQEGGKGSYTIKPVNKEALAWPGGRHPVAGVVHPPLPARPYLGLSADDQRMILDRCRAAVDRAFGAPAA
ncbi:MAG: phage virion morphogenesis protein [Betaproteobacteria bacterium]